MMRVLLTPSLQYLQELIINKVRQRCTLLISYKSASERYAPILSKSQLRQASKRTSLLPLFLSLHIVTEFCTRFNEHQVVLLCFLFTLTGSNFSLIVQIGLVANQHNNDIVASFSPDIVDPFSCVLE
ncbi:hypothetical protein EYC84_000445 [Monilinia fructicola]|uniref:Uncharacterized protein n=1 Tax=Monilinia fructicola TaxID=38448 RepID=A0A5M9JPA6_MONFR|nr:hypothetical protein EYC84_000445 [Monilinia fructicola]